MTAFDIGNVNDDTVTKESGYGYILETENKGGWKDVFFHSNKH